MISFNVQANLVKNEFLKCHENVEGKLYNRGIHDFTYDCLYKYQVLTLIKYNIHVVTNRCFDLIVLLSNQLIYDIKN